MRHRTNVTGDAARVARRAASDMLSLQHTMRDAHNSMAGLQRALRTAVIKTPRTRTRKNTTPSPLDFFGLLSLPGLHPSLPAGFYQSAIQASSAAAALLQQAQRIL